MTDTRTPEWDLTQLYTSIEDPKLERDIKKVERAFKRFSKQYAHSDSWLKSSKKLRRTLEDYEALLTLPKPSDYLFLLKSIHTDDKRIDARIAQAQTRLTRAVNHIVFFKLKLSTVSKEKQSEFLRSNELSDYRHFLKRNFVWHKYRLTEQEETLINSLDLPSEDMWVDLTERLIGGSEIEHDGKMIPLSKAMSEVSSLPTAKRRTLHRSITQKLHGHADVAEAELNALYTGKSVIDSRRGFKDPVDATLLSFENTKKEIEALRESVHDRYKLSHNFFALKKKLLGLTKLTYADRNADVGSISTSFSFEKSVDMLRTIFDDVHPTFRSILDDMLENGRIDAFSRKHKMSGAFCFGNVKFPTFVLLNHSSSFSSLTTLAHEMGHAIHTELAKRERPLYQGYSTSVAEFASTFFEDMIFDAMLPTLPKKEQKVLLHNRINRDISTTFRQIAFFEFEHELHEKIRSQGYVPKEEIAELLNAHTASYMGRAVEHDVNDGYLYVVISYIRRYFYAYSYAYGGILSRIASHRSKNDPSIFDGVVELLTSASNDMPKNLFKKLGINTEKKETFAEGFTMMEDDLKTLKNL